MSPGQPTWKDAQWQHNPYRPASHEYVHNRLSLSPVVHAFERINPHLAKDRAHKQTHPSERGLNNACRYALFEKEGHDRSPPAFGTKHDKKIAKLATLGTINRHIAEQLGVSESFVARAKRRLSLTLTKSRQRAPA